MPQQVIVTRTTTSTTATAIILNTGILRTASGLLKFFQIIIGAICLGLIAYYGSRQQSTGFAGDAEHTFFFLVAFGFLLTTFLIFISALMSALAATILPKSLFEFLYHLFGFVFYISASLALLVNVSNTYKHYRTRNYEGEMAAAVLGIINAVLYLLSTFFSFRICRSG